MSTMKVFESANNGVFMAIPSPQFYKELVLNKTNVLYNDKPRLLIEKINQWEEYFDVYSSNYISMFLLFNNWNELVDIVNDRYDNLGILKQKYLNIMNKTMRRHLREMDQKWIEFFKRVNFLK